MRTSQASHVAILVSIFFLSACTRQKGKFVSLSSEQTHITFNNIIVQNDSINVFDFPNIFNGGGVGVGDFNNDGLQDIYFTGNRVPNKMYLNKGDLKFEDVTALQKRMEREYGVAGWPWLISIMMEGWICMFALLQSRIPQDRVNILYVNQGNDEEQYLHV